MTAIKFLGTGVLLALIASPASALNMIEEPGMFAFVYPNGDLGLGASRRPADAIAMTPRLIMRHPLPARRDKAHK